MGPSRQNRKLQISGGSTYIVSFPKAWVEQMNLNAGDSVSMTKNDNNSLTIFPNGDSGGLGKAVAVVGPKDSDESIRRKIVAMYLAGYKSIKIMAKGIRLGPGQISAIRSFARSSMIGMEIIESNPEHVTIQTLTHLPELTFEVALRRMCTMTVDMHREALEALRTGDLEYAGEVVRLDDEMDRFTFYMLRNLTVAVGNAGMLQEMLLDSPVDCLYYRTVIARMERIADHAALIAKRVKYLAGPVEPDTIAKINGLSESVMKTFEGAVEALIRSDYHMAEDVSESVSRIGRIQEELMMSIQDSTRNATVVKFVLEGIRRSAEYTMDIAEVVMDRNIRNVINDAEQPSQTVTQVIAK